MKKPIRLALSLLIASQSAIFAQATRSSFSGTEVHVAWVEPLTFTPLPSGNVKITGIHLWYDDATADRLDGYVTVVIRGILSGKDGSVIQLGGEFFFRQQLDDYTLDDFYDGYYDPNLVKQGEINWSGVWKSTPRQGLTGVSIGPDGMKAFYTFLPSTDPLAHNFVGVLLDPHGE